MSQKALTFESLQSIIPDAYESNVTRMLGPLNFASLMYGMDNATRQAAFIATTIVETGKYKWLREIWGPSSQQLKYEPPHDLARRLGNTQSGDGSKYRGRGLIMITGRYNYSRTQRDLGVQCLDNPELLEAPLWASLSAGQYWVTHKCNRAADEGGIDAVTIIVNGGLTAIDERRAYFKRALEVLS